MSATEFAFPARHGRCIEVVNDERTDTITFRLWEGDECISYMEYKVDEVIADMVKQCGELGDRRVTFEVSLVHGWGDMIPVDEVAKQLDQFVDGGSLADEVSNNADYITEDDDWDRFQEARGIRDVVTRVVFDEAIEGD